MKTSLACLLALIALAAPASSLAAPQSPIREFPLPAGTGPEGITAGPDGNLWFAGLGSNAIGQITPAGEVREFPLPTPEARPFGIAAGPDGNVWFTEMAAGKIGRITPAGAITEFAVECGGCRPLGITAGPDGNVWFTMANMFGAVGRITPLGEITLIRDVGGSPWGIATGPDGNLWVGVTAYESEEPSFGQIARITPSGAVTLFRIPARYREALPAGITPGPDGKLWFAARHWIGRIDTEGQITMLEVPAPGEVNSIAAGPDGNLWFGSSGPMPRSGAIGRVTPGGKTSLFPVAYGSRGVTAGPDGGVWFTDAAGAGIGRIAPGMPGLGIESAQAQVPSRATRIALACSGGGISRCRGVLSLVIRKRLRSSGQPRTYETVLIGRAPYDLGSGQERSVKIRLTRRGLALLDRRTPFRVRAVGRAKAGQGMTRSLVLRR